MTFFLFSVALGFALGFFVKSYRVKKETQPFLHTISSLESTVTALKKQENDRQKNTAQWRLKREKNKKKSPKTTSPIPKTNSASSPNAAYMPKLPLIANVQKSFFIVLKNGSDSSIQNGVLVLKSAWALLLKHATHPATFSQITLSTPTTASALTSC